MSIDEAAVTPHPGLSLRATKVAARLEQLPPDRVYHLTLVKEHNRWLLAVHNASGAKIEVMC